MQKSAKKFSLRGNDIQTGRSRVKLSQNKKDLNDVTAALFSVSFSQLPAAKKHKKRGSCDVIKVLFIS